MRRRNKILQWIFGLILILGLIFFGVIRNELALIVVGSMLLSSFIYNFGKQRIFEASFQDVFDFKPTHEECYPQEYQRVDFILTNLAREFAWWDTRRAEFFGKPLSVPPEEKTSSRELVKILKTRIREKNRIELELQRAEKAFLHAHSLAKKEGFSVRDKREDYLPVTSVEPETLAR